MLAIALLIGSSGGCDDGVAPAGAVDRIEVSLSSVSLMVGASRAVTARALDADGNPVSATINWSVENASVATVSEDGLITGVGNGNTRVAASAAGKSALVTVGVSAVPVGVIRIAPRLATISQGQKVVYSVTITGTDGSPLSPAGRSITWASSNTSIATISTDGEATGVSAGSAVISATIEGKSDSASLTVSSSFPIVPPSIASVTFNPDSVSVRENRAATMTVRVTDSNGGRASLRLCTLRSDDITSVQIWPPLATTDGQGEIKVTVSGLNQTDWTRVRATCEARTGDGYVRVQ